MSKKKLSEQDPSKGPVKQCRFHFGDLDPVTKKTPGKQVHPFEPEITTGDHPRYEGPRDHPRLIAHLRLKLLTWLANCDTQPVIDRDIIALLKYIVGYACKGACSTQDLLDIFENLVKVSTEQTTMQSLCQKLLLKIIGMIDTPAAAADFLNTGGMLYHCTRRTRHIGLSGYRQLDTSAKDGKVTKATPLDQFLGEERRSEDPEITLWEWAKRCNRPASSACGYDHTPVFTGIPTMPVWPLSDDYAKGQLMIFSPGTWRNLDDLKGDHPDFVSAFAEFLDGPHCPQGLYDMIHQTKQRYERKKDKVVTNSNAQTNHQSDSQSSQGTTCSQASSSAQPNLGAALMAEMARMNHAELNDILPEIPLFTGGPDFDWYSYGIQCLGFPIPDNTTEWLKDISIQAERAAMENDERCDLPDVNLRLANPLQRVIIAINLRYLFMLKRGKVPSDQLRLIIQGTAGVGKTFVIKALTYIVRRLFGRNGAVMNLAPTGAASVLLPDGRTVHSVTPIPHQKKDVRNAQLSDYQMNEQSLKKLRAKTGTKEDRKLLVLNYDERGMFSKDLLAWSNQRLCEATTDFDSYFGGVPIVNFFGDLGQLGPVGDKDLHEKAAHADTPAKLAGQSIYKSFDRCVLLDQTMRQGPDQIALLQRLLRIRNGTVTQQDWIDINKRCINDLPQEEQDLFKNLPTVLTVMETWAEVNEENRRRLSALNVPVAIIPSVGSGKHHAQIDKQCGQIMHTSLIAVGSTVLLTKNQIGLTSLGLNNGAMGKVVAILYAKGTKPPEFPLAVVVDFPMYKGPAWIEDHPTWVPISTNSSRCESNCCSRTGLPLMPGYAIPIAKSQGMTVGANKSATHLIVKLRPEKVMEQLSVGTSYTGLSRVEKESDWALYEKIPADRILFINDHPKMLGRRAEEKDCNLFLIKLLQTTRPMLTTLLLILLYCKN